MSKINPVHWNEIYSRVDWDKVAAEISAVEETQPPMPDFEKEDCRELVFRAAKRWLPYDIVEWSVLGVEEEFESPLCRGFVDIRGVHRGELTSYQGYSGANFLCDWKTTRGDLDANWAFRYKYSWQWKMYTAAFPDTKLFHYRGINRRGDTREIIIETNLGVLPEVELYLSQLADMRKSLEGTEPWPKKMPGACNAYGRECEFYHTCVSNTIVSGELDIVKPFSYSGAETFMLCPEKHRLTQLAGYGDDDETLAFGNAFHRGIAEVYRQIFLKREDK